MSTHRIRTVALGIASLSALAVLAPTSSAVAATGVDLHHANLKNLTVPGSICHDSSPITLVNGTGKAGTFNTFPLELQEFGPVTFGDLTGDGQDEALVTVLCQRPNGTAASVVNEEILALTGSTGSVTLLGVITAQHTNDTRSPSTLLQITGISNGEVTVREAIFRDSDNDASPSGRATEVWSYSGGSLHVGTNGGGVPTAVPAGTGGYASTTSSATRREQVGLGLAGVLALVGGAAGLTRRRRESGGMYRSGR